MTDLIAKIKKQYASGYSSSPKDLTDEMIGTLIKEHCKCCDCDESIFDMWDFPNIDDGSVYCESCYEEYEYETGKVDYCDVCEDRYYKDQAEDPFPKSPFYYMGTRKIAGIYIAKSWPVFSSNYFSLSIDWWNVELVCSFKDFFKYKDNKERFRDLHKKYRKTMRHDSEAAEFICDDCFKYAKRTRDEKEATRSTAT